MIDKRIILAIVIGAGALAASASSLLGTVLVSGFLDGIHPCGIGVLLFFIAFLIAVSRDRKGILWMGAAYILGVFLAYLLIGLGIMQALTVFPPMFMAKLGAGLLALIALITAVDALTGRSTLRMPSFSTPWVQKAIEESTLPAALVAGFLVGLCAFPCAGGIYVAIIGLVASRVDFIASLAYLIVYNIAFVLPLVAILLAATNKGVIEKLAEMEKSNRRAYKFGLAVFMLALAAAIWFGAVGG